MFISFIYIMHIYLHVNLPGEMEIQLIKHTILSIHVINVVTH